MYIFQKITWHPISYMLFVFIYQLNLIVKMKKVQIPVTDNPNVMNASLLKCLPLLIVCLLLFLCCGTRIEK